MNNKISIFFLALCLTVVLGCSSVFAAEVGNYVVRPNQITIGTTYNGTILTVSGTIPEDSSAVIRMLGERENKTFKKKGKVFGFLWMNLDSITLHDVPGVFLISLDAKTYADGGDAWQQLGIGFQSFKGETDAVVYDEFIKLKSGEGLYSVQEGTITYGQPENGQKTFTAQLHVPSGMHKGTYDVQAFAVSGNEIVAKAEHEVHAVLDGFPAMLSTLAFDHSLIYGIAATIIAILAGLLMTVLFKDKGGAH